MSSEREAPVSERAEQMSPIEQLAELLRDVNAPVQIGLRAQGKFDTVRQMLADGCGSAEIGRAIGWDGKAALEWFAREAASELSALPPVRAEEPTGCQTCRAVYRLLTEVLAGPYKGTRELIEACTLIEAAALPPVQATASVPVEGKPGLYRSTVSGSVFAPVQATSAEHEHYFAHYEVCRVCGLTDAAINGCHHCNDDDSVKNGRCWWCLKPWSSPLRETPDLARVRALVERLQETFDPGGSLDHEVDEWMVEHCAVMDKLSAALEGAATKGK